MAGTPVLAPPDRELGAMTVPDLPVACGDHCTSSPEFSNDGGLVTDAAARRRTPRRSARRLAGAAWDAA